MNAVRAISLESHAHRLAKDLMAQWLREAAAAVGPDGHAELGELSWRVNRGAPHFGVWLEYPFLDGAPVAVWDERSERWLAAPPTYDELIALNLPPRVIVDIAVQHKGRIAWAIEITHKHPVDTTKLDFLRLWTDLTLIEIPAYWVLGQVDRPTAIPEEFFLTW
jgi:hypothetical protein